MFASYPMQPQQPSMMGCMPMTAMCPPMGYPTGASHPAPAGYGGFYAAYAPAPVMMAGAGSISPYSAGAYFAPPPASLAPMYFVVDPTTPATPPAPCPAEVLAAATPAADTVCGLSRFKMTHSGSGASLSTQSTCSGGETPSVVSNSQGSGTACGAAGAGGCSLKPRPQHDVRLWGFALVDPLHPSLQRIPVPPSCVCEPTLGIRLYDNDVSTSSTRPCKSSVCLLHAQGLGCAEGPHCRCFHVSPSYLHRCRSVTDPLCCAMHNCYYSQEMLRANCAPHLAGRYALSLDDPARFPQDGDKPYVIELSLLQLSLTVGLETLPCIDGVYVASWKRHVCHLNLDGKCKWTKDCGHVHVCRQLIKLLQDAETLANLKALQARHTTKHAADLYRDIILSDATLRFVRSTAALPLVSSLIEARDIEALKALVKAKCPLLPAQSAAVQQLGVALSTNVAATPITTTTTACAAAVNSDLLALLSPASP